METEQKQDAERSNLPKMRDAYEDQRMRENYPA